MTPNDALRAKMRRVRRARGWTQAGLAARLGVSQAVVVNLEGCRNGREFSLNEAVTLADVFGMSFAELIGPCPNCRDCPPSGFTCQACGTEGKPPEEAAAA